VPTKIIHDRAVEFLSNVLQDTAAILGLKQIIYPHQEATHRQMGWLNVLIRH